MQAIPVPPALRVGAPGRSFHAGGTFPMRQNPGRFEVDLLGRPTGFSRIHLVDASVFPSLPATTITLSVMANAHRIGSEAAES
jgi:choline dehydrogenase-like flavoprotein